MKLSIVIPVYFNEKNLPVTHARLSAALAKHPEHAYEIIYVDDGSGDGSWEAMGRLAREDGRVKLLRLSRNFGSHAAILAGMGYVTGDCMTMISADLQEPPEMIFRMLEVYGQGKQVVLAVRENREEPAGKKLFANTYYRLMRRFALANMPDGGFDCFLIGRRVVDVLCAMEEKNSTLMGQVLWCGFSTGTIYYTRQAREIGKSKWTLRKKIKLFVDSFVSFSYFPIRFMSVLGVVLEVLALLYGIAVVARRLFMGVEVEGWASLMVVMVAGFGLVFLMLGIMGEYLWRTFDAARRRPPFIVEEEHLGGGQGEDAKKPRE